MLDAKTREELTQKLIDARKSQKLCIDALQVAKMAVAQRAKELAGDSAVDAQRFVAGLSLGLDNVKNWQESINDIQQFIDIYEGLLGPSEDKVDENLK